MNRYLIIADDFTGANDTGVQIRRRGIPVSVVFSSEIITDDSSFVIDTESRALPADKAYERVSKALEAVDFSRFTVVKKVDSTLRGCIAQEIKAADEAYKSELVIFAPALPDLNRTTVNGIHLLNGKPITQTELANDPKTPVKEDHIQRLLQAVYNEPVTHIGLEELSGRQDFSQGRVFTFDAATNNDMRNIILSARRTGKRVLWVGTAAMADNLLGIESVVPPSLAVVASLSSISNEQVKYAEAQGVQLISVHIHELLHKKSSPTDYMDAAVRLLKEGRDVILLSSASYDRANYDLAVKAGAGLGLDGEAVSSYTQNAMGAITRGILDMTEVSGLFLTGGDTAIGFFEAAESMGSSIMTEIAIGIPLMKLKGGPFDGLKIITKAGAFGEEDILFYALRKLKEVI